MTQVTYSGQVQPDTLIRDNTSQLLECYYGTEMQLQSTPKSLKKRPYPWLEIKATR